MRVAFRTVRICSSLPCPPPLNHLFHLLVENELNVFKKACFSSEAEKKTLTEEVAALREKVEQLESAKNVRALSFLEPANLCN